MISFAHISDIHLAPLPTPSWGQLLSKRITGYVNWKKNRQDNLESDVLGKLCAHIKASCAQHVAISGDLINLSLPQEFIQVRQWLDNFGDTEWISVIPGNHDVYVHGSQKLMRQSYAPWMQSDWPSSSDDIFPYVKQRGDLALIGCSSAIATPPFCAAGYFDAAQAKRLATLLQQAKQQGLYRAVMIHHPPLYHATHFHKKLWGIGRFQNIIKQFGADVILHGHTHLPTLSYMDGPTQQIPVIGVSSASQGLHGHKPPACYNLLTIDKTNNMWQCHLQRFGIINDKNDIDLIFEQDFTSQA